MEERHGDGEALPLSVEELIAVLPDHLAELIVLLDESGTILWFNRPAESALGWLRADWLGRNVVEIVHPEEVALATELLVSARATGPGAKEPVRYRIASAYDGWLLVEAVASAAELATGRSVLVVSARSTGRTRDQQHIVGEVGERLSVVFDVSLVGMAMVDCDGRILRANQRLADRVGVALEALVGAPLTGLIAPSERSAVALALDDLWTSPCSDVLPVRLECDSLPAELHVEVVPDWVGEPLYMLVQFADGDGRASVA